MTYYNCYYCNYHTDWEQQYIEHGMLKHKFKPIFPNQAELERHHLEPQGQRWEQPFMTEEQAKENLAIWAEKRMKQEKEKPTPEPKEVKTYSYTEGYLFTRTTLDDYE